MKILIATKNPAKAKEIKTFLEGYFSAEGGPASGWEVVSLADFPNAPDIEETGKTFEENAILKAIKYFEWSGIPAVADDAGLEIDYLNGEPGVKSRRWLGYEMTDQEMIDTALEKLKGVSIEKRTTHLVAVGAFFNGQNTIVQKGSIDGNITEGQTVECLPGYPFDAIFWVSKFNKLYLDLKREGEINHRKVLYQKLAHKISELEK